MWTGVSVALDERLPWFRQTQTGLYTGAVGERWLTFAKGGMRRIYSIKTPLEASQHSSEV